MRIRLIARNRHLLVTVPVVTNSRWSRYRRVERVVNVRREFEVEAIPRHETVDRLFEVEELRKTRFVSEKTGERPRSLDTDRVDGVVELVEETSAVGKQQVHRSLEIVQQPGVARQILEDVE